MNIAGKYKETNMKTSIGQYGILSDRASKSRLQRVPTYPLDFIRLVVRSVRRGCEPVSSKSKRYWIRLMFFLLIAGFET